MATKIDKHNTITGETLEYPRPSKAVAAFLARVVDGANDPNVSEAELTALVYGKENPLLDQTMFPHHGAVTVAVFADPVYHVMLDLLGRKRVQAGTLDLGAVSAASTMTITEAAAELGVTSSAVRQAIHAHRLPAIKRGGSYLLDPRDVASFRVMRRGPKPRGEREEAVGKAPAPEEREPDLRLRIGNKPGGSFRVKVDGFEVTGKEGKVVDGVVREFRGRAAIAFSGKDSNRMMVLEPAEEEESFEIGGFYVRGKFRVVEKVNNPREAAERWKGFKVG